MKEIFHREQRLTTRIRKKARFKIVSHPPQPSGEKRGENPSFKGEERVIVSCYFREPVTATHTLRRRRDRLILATWRSTKHRVCLTVTGDRVTHIWPWGVLPPCSHPLLNIHHYSVCVCTHVHAGTCTWMCAKEEEWEDMILPYRYSHGVNRTKIQYKSRTKISFWFKRIKIEQCCTRARVRPREQAGVEARSQQRKE